MQYLPGMFFVKYGVGVTVSGAFRNEAAMLDRRSNPLLYYFDATGRPVEVEVRRKPSSAATPHIPATFGGALRLDGYELSSATADKGSPIVVLLYWRDIRELELNYNVFVHLICNGEVVAGVDGPPGHGRAPTSTWRPGDSLVDAMVLDVPADAPAADDYAIEVGLYNPSTMERLPLVEDGVAVSGNRVVIGPVEIQ